MNAMVTNLSAPMTAMTCTITASGVNYNGTGGNPFACKDLSFNTYNQTISVMVSMAASDTAVFSVTVYGGVGNTATVVGAASPNTWCMGYLIC